MSTHSFSRTSMDSCTCTDPLLRGSLPSTLIVTVALPSA
jgi:hypothetical protein